MDAVQSRIRKEEKEKEKATAKKRLKTRKRTDKEGKETAKSDWKIRHYPTKNERERLNQWIGIYRCTYNQCIVFYKQSGKPLQANSLKKCALKENCKEQGLDTLHNCRDKTVEDFVSAFEISKKINLIGRELFRTDNLNLEINQKKNGNFVHNRKRRQKMKKAMRRVFCNVKNEAKEAHHKISKFLWENMILSCCLTSSHNRWLKQRKEISEERQ
jgi:hypothetical protein